MDKDPSERFAEINEKYKNDIIETLIEFDERILQSVPQQLRWAMKAFLDTDFSKWRNWEPELKSEIEAVVKVVGDKYREKM